MLPHARFGSLSLSVLLLLAASTAFSVENGYAVQVEPLLKEYCNRCHNAEKKSGDFTLHTLTSDLASGRNIDTWFTIARKLRDGEMPPEEAKQPPPEQIQKALAWIDAESAKAGATGIVASGNLRSGNHVPHELLFRKAVAQPASSPARLWRISPQIYEAFTQQFGKDLKLGQPFAVPPGEGFKDMAGNFGLDEAAVGTLLRNASHIVDVQLGQTVRKTGAVKELLPLIDEQKPATRAQTEAAIQKEFEIVLNRKPSRDELERFVALHESNVKTGGALIGTRTTLASVFMLPEASFRFEVGAAAADASGRHMLAPRELAFALAYALTDKAPDAMLLKAADSGQLASKADVEREVARLLKTEGIEGKRMLRFLQEYFGYRSAPDIFKDPKAPGHFSAHRPEMLVDDTSRLILLILREDRDVLKELLTTTRSFVTIALNEELERDERNRLKKEKERKEKEAAGLLPPPAPPKEEKPKKVLTPEEQEKERVKRAIADAKYAESRAFYKAYNASERIVNQPGALPPEQRAGILTQPSWLVAHSDNFDNHAIRRGKWIRERLLGGTVPDIPISVDAQLPDDKTKTLRERMEVTKQAYCWQCHQKMNPAGLGFEMFDHFGRFRTEELGKPVVTTAVLEKTGDPALDGTYPNAVAMLRKLAESERVRQVFVRHAFRFWMGREETLADAVALQSADRAYVQSGGSMKALITAVLTSDAFLYRTSTGVATAK